MALLWLLFLTACRFEESGEATEPRHVVIVVVDTLRADHLPLYGYRRDTAPFLSKLGAEGAVFDHAVSTSSYTAEAISSLFTGYYPSATSWGAGWHARPSLNHQTLALRFREAGYKTALFSESPMLVGEQEVEEVDSLPAGPDGLGAGRGANLGWAQMEGDQVFEDGEEPADHTPPLFSYTHADGGCTVIGGYVYRGTEIPGLQGAYLFADRCLMQVHALVERDGEVVDEADLAEVPQGAVSFGEDAAGRLYLLQQSGEVLRIVPGRPSP